MGKLEVLERGMSVLEADVHHLRCIVGGERMAREEHHDIVQESIHRHFAYENLERSLRDTTVHDRLERLEQLIGSSPTSEAAQARARLDQLKRQLVDTTLIERVATLEQVLEDSLEKNAKALDGTGTTLEQMHQRLRTCEQHSTASFNFSTPPLDGHVANR